MSPCGFAELSSRLLLFSRFIPRSFWPVEPRRRTDADCEPSRWALTAAWHEEKLKKNTKYIRKKQKFKKLKEKREPKVFEWGRMRMRMENERRGYDRNKEKKLGISVEPATVCSAKKQIKKILENKITLSAEDMNRPPADVHFYLPN